MSKKGLWQRWKQTTIANQAIVVTGILMFISSALYTCTTIFQVAMWRENARQSGEQTDKLIVASERMANTASRQAEDARKVNSDILDRMERITLANEELVKAANTQASASQVAARTAEKSAAIAFQLQRPQVFLKTAKLSEPLTANKEPSLQFTITNVGSVAAVGVFRDITRFLDEYPFSGVLSYSRGGPTFRFVLAPTADNKILLKFRSLTQEKIKTLHDGRARLYFFGEGEYKDIFGRSYPLSFCYMYDKDVDGNVIICPSYLTIN